MKKKSISIIIGLMAFALLGVMAMQLYFLQQSYQLKSELFDQSVNQALTNVVNKLEKRDQINFLTEKVTVPVKPQKEIQVKPRKRYEYVNRYDKQPSSTAPSFQDTISNKPTAHFYTRAESRPSRGLGRNRNTWKTTSGERYAALIRKEQRKVDSIFRIKDSLMRVRHPNAIAFTGPAPAVQDAGSTFKLNISVFEDEFGTHVTQELLQNSTINPGRTVIAVPSRINPIKIDSVRQYVVLDPELGPIVKTIPKPRIVSLPPSPPQPPTKVRAAPTKKEVKLVNQLIDSVQKKRGDFQELVTEFKNADISLRKRVEPALLDSLLKIELASRGLKGNYYYKVTSAKHDSVIFTKVSNQTNFDPANTYSTSLFPKDMIRDAGLLTITFPDKNSVIMSNLTAMMASSGALLLILVFCFGFTIYSILRQKKISEMKTDFINNMTHEFKTPVSTIMIASESLRDPDIVNDRNRVNRLASIIYDENVRLGNHIERVLNIARIDKGDLKLELKPVEMNDLIVAVLDSMSLQLQKKGTEINFNLNAKRSVVHGDELHLSNVIFNLVDNANKYSGENSKIVVSTVNHGKHLIIRVTDNGIGMSRDQQAKIFDQFYRIPTGNLHDVKGFGLGLSYVSNIVKRLGGTIKVRSEKDKGSEFEIILQVV